MTRPLRFEVAGMPVPQGSKRLLRNRIVDSNAERLKPWRADIMAAAQAAVDEHGSWLRWGPMRVELVFYYPRPKHHYIRRRRGGAYTGEMTLRSMVPLWKDSNPDLDKTTRAVCDALTGVVWHDDAQVADLQAVKFWHDRGLLAVTVERLEDPPPRTPDRQEALL